MYKDGGPTGNESIALDLCIAALLNNALSREGYGPVKLDERHTIAIPYVLDAPFPDTRRVQFGFITGHERGFERFEIGVPMRKHPADAPKPTEYPSAVGDIKMLRFRVSRTVYGFKPGATLYDMLAFVQRAFNDFAGAEGNAAALEDYKRHTGHYR